MRTIQREAMSWCLANNIKIYVEPTSKGRKSLVKIIVNNKGNISIGIKEYIQDKNVSEIINSLYLHLYNKLN